MVIGTRALGARDSRAIIAASSKEEWRLRCLLSQGRRNVSSVARALWRVAEASSRGEEVAFPLSIPLNGGDSFQVDTPLEALALLRRLGGPEAKRLPKVKGK